MKTSSLRLACLAALALPSLAAWGETFNAGAAPLPPVVAGLTGVGTQTTPPTKARDGAAHYHHAAPARSSGK